jgi:hypothetical protein
MIEALFRCYLVERNSVRLNALKMEFSLPRWQLARFLGFWGNILVLEDATLAVKYFIIPPTDYHGCPA